MDRKTARGVKPKNVPVGNLITLGNKSAGRSDAEKNVAFPIGKPGGEKRKFFDTYNILCGVNYEVERA